MKQNKSQIQWLYTCMDCGWSGNEDEVELELTETCLGDDETESCPKCKSINVRPAMKSQ